MLTSPFKQVSRLLEQPLYELGSQLTVTDINIGVFKLKLKKADAIDLVITLIQAMTIANEVNMVEFEAAKVTQEGEEANEKNPPLPGVSGIQKDKKISVHEKEKIETPKTKFNKENVCYFYTTWTHALSVNSA